MNIILWINNCNIFISLRVALLVFYAVRQLGVICLPIKALFVF